MKWLPYIVIGGAGALLFARSAMAGEKLSSGGTSGGALSPFAEAIGRAEGYYVQGSRSNRNNNPGDMVLVPPASNYTKNSDGTYAVFDTAQDGWQALEDQLDYIRRRVSKHYTPDMTFAEMAHIYSPDGEDAWAANVAGFLGASVTEQIGNYL